MGFNTGISSIDGLRMTDIGRRPLKVERAFRYAGHTFLLLDGGGWWWSGEMPRSFNSGTFYPSSWHEYTGLLKGLARLGVITGADLDAAMAWMRESNIAGEALIDLRQLASIAMRRGITIYRDQSFYALEMVAGEKYGEYARREKKKLTARERRNRKAAKKA